MHLHNGAEHKMTVFHDPTLVMLSIFIAITGALTGLAITAGYDRGGRRNEATSLIKGAIVIGASIWAMHFVAMLAVRLPVLISYRFVETVLSLYIAIMGTGLGLFLVSRRRLGFSVPIGGLLMGAAIGGCIIWAWTPCGAADLPTIGWA
jgi:NO-binding membrane sensor protein with MHYT domain